MHDMLAVTEVLYAWEEGRGGILRYFRHIYRRHLNLLATSLLSPNNSNINNNNNNNNNFSF
jgi:hypothetical protein